MTTKLFDSHAHGAPIPVKLRELAAMSRAADAVPALTAMALNPAEELRARHVALSILRDEAIKRGAVPEVRVTMRRALESSDVPLKIEAIRGLAWLGEASDVEALAVHARAKNPVAMRATFAQAVIAHRLGLATSPLRPAGALPLVKLGPALRPVPVRRMFPPEAAVLAQIAADVPYGMRLGPELTTHLNCAGREQWISVDEGARDGRVFVQRALPAVVGLRNWTTGEVSTALLAMTTPTGTDSFDIGLYSRNGSPRFAGTGSRSGGLVTFELGAVARPGAAAMRIRGRWDGVLVIDEASLGPIPVPSRRASPI